jgi:hypothetical protein
VLAAEAPFPTDAWTLLDPRRNFLVANLGARAAHVVATYRANPSRLGQRVSLLVDGVAVAEQMIATNAGTIEADVTPGQHRFELQDLGPGGLAFVDARPINSRPDQASTVVRRRVVFRVRKDDDLVFRIPQHPHEVLHVILFVASERMGARTTLEYQIDGGTPRTRVGEFFRRPTTPKGLVTGKTGEEGKGLLWEAPVTKDRGGSAPDGTLRAAIHLGDDLQAGTHVVRLRFLNSAEPELWVRAVLVGQEDAPGGSDTRLFTEREGP